MYSMPSSPMLICRLTLGSWYLRAEAERGVMVFWPLHRMLKKNPEKPCPGTCGDQRKTYQALCVPDLSNTPTLPLAALQTWAYLSSPPIVSFLIFYFTQKDLKHSSTRWLTLVTLSDFCSHLITGFWLKTPPRLMLQACRPLSLPEPCVLLCLITHPHKDRRLALIFPFHDNWVWFLDMAHCIWHC